MPSGTEFSWILILTLALYLALAPDIIPYAMMTKTTITVGNNKMGNGNGKGRGRGKGRHGAITSGRVPCF